MYFSSNLMYFFLIRKGQTKNKRSVHSFWQTKHSTSFFYLDDPLFFFLGVATLKLRIIMIILSNNRSEIILQTAQTTKIKGALLGLR